MSDILLTMYIRPENQRRIVWILGLLLLASFAFLLFHHHSDGADHIDCPVCRLVQQLFIIFVPLIALISALICRTHIFIPVKKLSSFLLADNLQGRAPPQF